MDWESDAQLVHQTILAFDQSILDALRGKTPASSNVKFTPAAKSGRRGQWEYASNTGRGDKWERAGRD
jgi:hypothetical protein